MKVTGIFITGMLAVCCCSAQGVKYTPNPKAKAVEDTAIARYQRSAGDPAKVSEVFRLLDEAIKIDNKYFEGWLNKMTLQSQTGKYDDALNTLKKMAQIFPDNMEVPFHTGILLYKTGKNKEALATFNKLLDRYNTLLQKEVKSPNVKGWLINKGIVLILVDRASEGKAILNKIYNEEKEYYVKSYVAFYINGSKQEIIEDRVPGK